MRSRISLFSTTVALVLACTIVVPGASAQPAAVRADPSGTVTLVENTVPSTVRLDHGTRAGLVYTTDREVGGRLQQWVRPFGQDPVRLPSHVNAMNGSMLFFIPAVQSPIRYGVLGGPTRTCPVPPDVPLGLTPTGWAYVDREAGQLMLVTAADSGCTTRPLVAVPPVVRISDGDERGIVVGTREGDQPSFRMRYVRYSDPGHPIELGTVAGDEIRLEAPEVGGIVIRADGPDGRSLRWLPLDGGAAVALPAGLEWFTRSTRTHVAAGGPFRTAALSGGALVTSDISGDIASDGRYFYTGPAPGQAPGIYRRVDAADPGTLVVARPNTLHLPWTFGIAVSPGGIYYTTHDSGDTRKIWTRTLTRDAGSLRVGPAQLVAGKAYAAQLAASAGRLVFDHQHRDHTGAIRKLPWPAWTSTKVSGNRALVDDVIGAVPDIWTWADLYDVRTDRLANPGQQPGRWPGPPQDLFGNYLLYARADGTVVRRDLSTGREIILRKTGSPIGSVAIHGRWVAWVTDCQRYCPQLQTITIRDLAIGTTTTLITRGTQTLDLSGGYLAFDAIPNAADTRQLRVVRHGTRTLTSISRLPADVNLGMWDFYSAPRHFDLDDETIGWLDSEAVGKVAPLTAFVDPPVYLGNPIAPAAISPNGDGIQDTWSATLPVSKALPTCTVTIYRGGTAVRILNCANRTGMAAVTWDGRTGAGAKLPRGTYTYRLNGRDNDGWIRHADLRLVPITGSIKLS